MRPNGDHAPPLGIKASASVMKASSRDSRVWTSAASLVAFVALACLMSLAPQTPVSGSVIVVPEAQLRSSSAVPSLIERLLVMPPSGHALAHPPWRHTGQHFPRAPPAGSHLVRQVLQEQALQQQQQKALRAERAQAVQQAWTLYPRPSDPLVHDPTCVPISCTALGQQDSAFVRSALSPSYCHSL